MKFSRRKPEPCPEPVIDMDTTAMSPLIKIRLAEACKQVGMKHGDRATALYESGDYLESTMHALIGTAFMELGTEICTG